MQRLIPDFQSLARASTCDPQGYSVVRGRYIYIFPSRAGFSFGLMLAVMLLGSLNYQNNLGLLFTFIMAAVALVGMHHTWFNLLGLRVSARGEGPVFAGDLARFSVYMDDDGTRARADLIPVVGKQRFPPVQFARGRSAAQAVYLPTEERGICRLERIQIETRYPLGLFRAWCYAQVRASLIVYPKPAHESFAPSLLASANDAGSGGDHGSGTEDFVGLRGYRTGDSPRLVDWKAYARERGLVVKQFGGDRVRHLWLDWDRFTGVDTEQRLGLLCRQVLDAAALDVRYGLRLPGTRVPLDRGEAHKHRCLTALAHFGHEN